MRGDLVHPFLNKLTVRQLIGAALEDHLDLGQIVDGLGADQVQAGGAREHLLEWHRDEVLHLVGGQPHGQGLDLHLRGGELREHVDGHPAHLDGAEGHQAQRERDDKEPEPQSGPDNAAHQTPAPCAALTFGQNRFRPVGSQALLFLEGRHVQFRRGGLPSPAAGTGRARRTH